MSKSKHHKKKRVVLPYITKPVIYVLISFIFIIPMCFGLLKLSINMVHTVQPKFPSDISEIKLNDSNFTPSEKFFGEVDIPKLEAGDKVGVISCENAGLSTDVYYGCNRVSFRGGAGIHSKNSLPGQGGAIRVSSNASGGFKALENLEKGDMIAFSTSWGAFEYKIVSIETVKTVNEEADGETLILTTESSKDAFANFKEEKLCVKAQYVSGPSAGEVQQ